MTARARWGFRLGGLIALALIAAGMLVAVRGGAEPTGAAGAVRAYFAALQRGDAAGALAEAVVPAGRRLLLTDAVLREQDALGPLRDVVVGSASTKGDRGSVRVRYRVALPDDPQQVDDVVPVVRRQGTWLVARAAVRTSLALAQANDRAALLGHSLPRGPVLLFPGAVPVRFDSPYLQFGPGTGAITFATGAQTLLPVQLSQAGTDAVVAAMTTALRTCLAGTAPVDPRCPLPDDRYVPGSVRGALTGSVADAVHAQLQAGPSGLISITGSIAVTASYTRLSYANVPRSGRGAIQLDLSATAYAVRPLTVSWTDG
ncbi:MAG: hypothetical protein ACTHMS_10800 [Jatrophihabitans sp.]|uniref:hypothetical protein n=1 Tax=Jatrophihabitans sp. TaxID=1932789 RepID=UPI003F7EF05F